MKVRSIKASEPIDENETLIKIQKNANKELQRGIKIQSVFTDTGYILTKIT